MHGRTIARSLPQSADRFLAAAGDYVVRYQAEFEFLVADELGIQHAFVPVGAAGDTVSRLTRGELFITYLDAERQWTAVRDIAEVDGTPIRDRVDLVGLLQTEDLWSMARRVFALNARFNIGRTVRNFNDPMLALLPLGAARRDRFSFSVAAIDRADPARPLVTLAFRERERPTLVRDVQGRSVYATGHLLIEPGGLVRRTAIAFDADGVHAELGTEFAPDDRLGRWLPAWFAEQYVASREGRTDFTVCRSWYSNYRRFDVRARVLPVSPQEAAEPGVPER